MQRSKLAELSTIGHSIDSQENPLTFHEWQSAVDCTLKTIDEHTEQ